MENKYPNLHKLSPEEVATIVFDKWLHPVIHSDLENESVESYLETMSFESLEDIIENNPAVQNIIICKDIEKLFPLKTGEFIERTMSANDLVPGIHNISLSGFVDLTV